MPFITAFTDAEEKPKYKYWTVIRGFKNIGDELASTWLDDFHEVLIDHGVRDLVVATKISTDGTALLFVLGHTLRVWALGKKRFDSVCEIQGTRKKREK